MTTINQDNAKEIVPVEEYFFIDDGGVSVLLEKTPLVTRWIEERGFQPQYTNPYILLHRLCGVDEFMFVQDMDGNIKLGYKFVNEQEEELILTQLSRQSEMTYGKKLIDIIEESVLKSRKEHPEFWVDIN